MSYKYIYPCTVIMKGEISLREKNSFFFVASCKHVYFSCKFVHF